MVNEKAGGNKKDGGLKRVVLEKFSKYREENDKIIVEVKRLLKIADTIKTYGDNKVGKSDVLTKKSKLTSDKAYGEVFDALGRDSVEFETHCNALKENIEAEDKVIREFMGLSTYEYVSTNKQLLGRIINFNQDKINSVQRLFHYVPSLAADLKGVVDVVELGVENSAKFFIAFYKEFNKHLDESVDKGSLFFTLSKILKNLVIYAEEFNSQYSENKTAFMNEVGKIDSGTKVFAERFFAGGYGYNKVKELNQLLSKYDLNLGSLDEGSTYKSLKEDEDREKIDKFVKETLLHLLAKRKAQITKIEKIYGEDEEDNKSGSDKSDTDKALVDVRSKFTSLLAVIGAEVGDYAGFSTLNLRLETIENSKQPFRGFFDYLLGDKKSNIVENDGKYSCDRFEKLVEKIDKFYDKQASSIFLKFCFDNFDNLSSGNYDNNLISSFFRNLTAITGITGFHK